MQLSPSEVHHRLMSEVVPEFRYDGGDVGEWQGRLGAKLRELLGDMPAERCDLEPRSIWQREHPLGVIEKVAFTSEPFADIPAYVCLPKDAAPPYTFVVCVQGHSSGMHNSIAVEREDETKPLEIEGDRDFGVQCMARGLAALCIEQRSFGERREQRQENQFPGMCHDAAMHALMLGRTLIGERVYDVDRGIDYLASRGDADMKSIGIMGNSGGGTTSLFSAAMLPRIAFATPSCYFCTFRDSIMSIRHCTCNFVPGMLAVAEMADILGLFAPRPVVIVAGRDDPIFPIDATRRAFGGLERIYEASGAEGRCHLVVGDGGHRFYADDAWPVMLEEIGRLRGSGQDG